VAIGPSGIAQLGPSSANSPLPPVLSPSLGDGLPLEVPNRVRLATGERLNVIFPVAGTGPVRFPSRRARVLPLEFARHFTGSIFSG
jgi:hypothetical protein